MPRQIWTYGAFLNKTQISEYQARFLREWPPKGRMSYSSPVHPIEPWGKQFFVYNAPKNVEQCISGDPRAPPAHPMRPRWMQEEITISMLKKGERLQETLSNELTPMLAICDFRRRLLSYLTREELETIVSNFDWIEDQMNEFAKRQKAIDDVEITEYEQAEKDIRELTLDKYANVRKGQMIAPHYKQSMGSIEGKTRNFARPHSKDPVLKQTRPQGWSRRSKGR